MRLKVKLGRLSASCAMAGQVLPAPPLPASPPSRGRGERVLVPAALMLLVLAACGSKTACFAMSDEDATAKVVAEYAKLPATDKGDPQQMQFSPTRVVGVGRNSSTKGDGKGLTQVWFMQD